MTPDEHPQPAERFGPTPPAKPSDRRARATGPGTPDLRRDDRGRTRTATNVQLHGVLDQIRQARCHRLQCHVHVVEESASIGISWPAAPGGRVPVGNMPLDPGHEPLSVAAANYDGARPTGRAVRERTVELSPADGNELRPGPGSATTSDLVTRPDSRSTTLEGPIPSAPATPSQASSVQPPVNTASRAKNRCSAGDSSP